MLFFLDVIGKAIGDHPMFFSYRQMRKKKTLGNHPMIFGFEKIIFIYFYFIFQI
jgi:hypothetical protein